MDIISAYREAGTYRGAAAISGTTPKTVRRVIARHEAGGGTPARSPRGHNYDAVAVLVAERVDKTSARISAKRLLPAARAAGYAGSPRNFRRLVAAQKHLWRRDHHRGRRPAVWSPGEHLVIDWGAEDGLHVFCAVLAWCRFRFVRFAADERAETTLAMLAQCLEVLGGVPGKVLADRMGCLKGGVVANVVVPAPEYLRFAAHYGFRPDFCEANDPESKGIVENLVGYAKSDLMVPQAPFGDLAAANAQAAAWCAEVNGVMHSEICAVPAERLVIERELLAPLPSLRASIGRLVTRKVDRLSCVRFGSARYSVPVRLIGETWAASHFPDSFICVISCCELPVQVLVVGLLRSPVTECRMETLPIIADLDVPGNVLPCFLSRRVRGSIHPLDLNRRVKRFRQRIIETDPGTPDRLADPQVLEHAGELGRGVITPAVRVEYRAGREIDIPGRHLDRRSDQRRLVIVAHRPADDLSGRAVDHRRKIFPPLPRRDVGNVADHFLPGLVGAEVPVDQVRDRPGRSLLGGGRPPRPRLAGDQAQLTHELADQLPAGYDALAGQLRGDPPVPVRPVGIDEYRLDQQPEPFLPFRRCALRS